MKKIISIILAGILLMAGASAGMAQGPMEKFADKTIDKVEKNCRTELETYCLTVTPGEGRGAACLYAHEDKLSALCKDTLYEVRGEFKNASENIGMVIEDCQSDIVRLCSKVEVGEGRVLSCLEKNKGNIGLKCRESMRKARGDLGKPGQVE